MEVGLDEARALFLRGQDKIYRPAAYLKKLECSLEMIAHQSTSSLLLPPDPSTVVGCVLAIDFEDVTQGHYFARNLTIRPSPTPQQLAQEEARMRESLRWAMSAFFWLPSSQEFLGHEESSRIDGELTRIAFRDFAAVSYMDEGERARGRGLQSRALWLDREGKPGRYEFRDSNGLHQLIYTWEPVIKHYRLRSMKETISFPEGVHRWEARLTYQTVQGFELPETVTFQFSPAGQLSGRTLEFRYRDYKLLWKTPGPPETKG